VRRRRLPPDLERPFAAFSDVLAEVEPAKAALAEVMPTTRLPGRPLPDAMLAFEEHLRRAKERMPTWRAPALEEAWRRCDDGVAGSLARARRFREDPPAIEGFECLLWAVGELLEPLEPFGAAAARFRALRTGPGARR
jgi:hypothetical protein